MTPYYEILYTPQAEDVDAGGQLTPEKLLYLAQEAAGEHCRLLGADREALLPKRLFWAVIRHRAQITSLPRLGQPIRVRTWPLPTTRTAYPRATAAYDESGNLLFRVISLWVLMDMDTRAMILPGKSGVEVTGSLLGGELSAPGAIGLLADGTLSMGQVTESDLDRNGHMNNCRCLGWTAQLLPNQLADCREFTVCYYSEAFSGELLQLKYAPQEDGTLQVDAVRTGTEMSAGHSRVFSLKLLF